MRRAPLVLAFLILLALAPPVSGQADGLAEDWEVSLTITSSSAGSARMFEAFDTASLNLYDIDGDGDREIISVNDNNHVYVLDGLTGRVLADLTTYHYNNTRWPTRELNPVAVGELYGDGRNCLVVPNSASWLTAFCHDADASTPLSMAFEKMWEVPVDAALYEEDFEETHPFLYYENGTAKQRAGMDGHAYLADVDGDDTLEIFVETDSWPGQFSFSADGEYRWSRSWADGNAGAIVRDIDKDGVKEAVFFSDGGLVNVFNAKTGSFEWNFDTRKNNATPGSIPVPGLVADLHGDGTYETIFGARQAVQTDDPDWINQSHARYFALDSKGKLLWNVSYDWMNPLQYNHPAAADVNGDGVLDVVILDWNTIGHKPGNWNTTERPSNLFALDGRDGSVLWKRGITVYWSNKDFVIMDVDGDGDQEIVAPTAKAGCEGLGLYDLETGEPRGFFCAGDGWSMTRGPVAADLDGDGDVELVIPYDRRAEGPNYRSIDVGYREGKLVVIETGAARSGVTFSANFQLNDEIDLGLKGSTGVQPRPTTPTPVSTTPPTATTPVSTTPTTTTMPTTTSPATTTPASTSPVVTTPVTTTRPVGTTPVATDPLATTPTDPDESTVPGPGLAIAVAAVAAAVVLARRRR